MSSKSEDSALTITSSICMSDSEQSSCASPVSSYNPSPYSSPEKPCLETEEDEQPQFSIQNKVQVAEWEDTDALPLYDRVRHENWTVRQAAYSEVADYFRTGKNLNWVDVQEDVYEVYLPWLKEMLSDRSLTCLVEAIKAMLSYVKSSPIISSLAWDTTITAIDILPIHKPEIYQFLGDVVITLLRRNPASSFLISLVSRIGDKNIYKTYLLLSVLPKIDPEGITQEVQQQIYDAVKPYETADHAELQRKAQNLVDHLDTCKENIM